MNKYAAKWDYETCRFCRIVFKAKRSNYVWAAGHWIDDLTGKSVHESLAYDEIKEENLYWICENCYKQTTKKNRRGWLRQYLRIKEMTYFYKRYHSGRENAIKRDQFRIKYDFDYIPDREFRRIYANHLPICTCSKGGFYPANMDEAIRFKNKMQQRAEKIKNRGFRVLDEFYREENNLKNDVIAREPKGES